MDTPSNPGDIGTLFDHPVVDHEGLTISAPVVVLDRSARSPDVAVDPDGAAWVAWTQGRGDRGEQVLVRRFGASGAGPVHQAGPLSDVACQPCIVALPDGWLRLFWITHRDRAWRLVTRSFRSATFGPESEVASSADGLFHPRAALDASGACHVACESVDGHRTRVTSFRPAEDAWIEAPLDTLPGDCYRPDVCSGPGSRLWVAYDAYADGRYRVAVQPLPASDAEGSSDPVVIADAGYQNVHPSLAPDGSGHLWIALASNRNDALRDPAWLTKWSYLVHFDGETVSEPAARRPDLDLYNEHAYQGWEFPAVAADRDGGVVLFGQSAHSLLAQACSGNAWSAAHTIVERKWGSWKPRCRVAGSGPFYLVSMGLDGAQVQRVTWAKGASRAPIRVPAGRPLSAQVNPDTRIQVREHRPTVEAPDGTMYRIYFGDLHGHAAYGDAIGDVDEFYHRYRDAYGYDFAALTEHDYLDGIELSRSELKRIWNHADRVSVDGAFLAWYAYEWTSPAISVHAAEGAAVGEGHRHVLYPDSSGPLVRYAPAGADTGRKLLDRLAGVRALVIPHHTSWSGTDWDAHDDRLQRVVEIVSTHGRFEYPGNRPIGYRRDHIHAGKTVQDALNRGYRLGFVGGSDSHGLRWHAIELEGRAAHIPEGTRVGWKEDAYRTGMTAVLAEALTRESLFRAVYDRRCYATSGVPIVLDFRVNDALMGSELTTRTTPRITAQVEGTAAIRSIEVIRSGHVLGGMQMLPGEGLSSVGFALDDRLLIPGESVYYYMRVLQEDGNMAWSSPIWVRYA